MIYSLSLQSAGLLVGILMIFAHAIALIHGEFLRKGLALLPRSRTMGILLCTAAAAWAFWLVATVDLGEFATYRKIFLLVIAAAWLFSLFWMEEFLAVRAMGMLLMLAAEPLLEAAWLQPQPSRLLLPILAYVWIVMGLFLVGKPYLMRDWLAWFSKTNLRWRMAALAGLLYGVALLLAAIFYYGK